MEPGDSRARFALQKLADRGHFDRTVSTWPLMMGSIKSALGRSSIGSDTKSVGDAVAYLKFEMDQQGSTGWRAEYEMASTSEPSLIRGFESSPDETALANINVQWQGEYLAAGLKPAFTANPEDDESFRLDGSYLAGTFGNWVLGAGAIDRWWGPGWQSSLILSNNARPVPAVWLNRNNAREPESQWLQWVGPWQFTLFAGQLEEERVVPDTKLIGMRFTFRPLPGLDVGLSRAIMFGGEGFPERASTVWQAFTGDDNGPADQQPGNQLASLDVRYGFGVGQHTLGFYGQVMGEDEAGFAPAKKSWLVGVDATTQLFSADQQWFVELSNTLADDILGDSSPNVSYEHFRYQSGYRHLGRNIASTFDSDAETATVGAFNFFSDGSNLSASITYVNLNKDGSSRVVVADDKVEYAVPEEAQKLALASLGYGTRLLSGWLDLTVQVTDKKVQLVSGEKDQWSLGAAWRYRF